MMRPLISSVEIQDENFVALVPFSPTNLAQQWQWIQTLLSEVNLVAMEQNNEEQIHTQLAEQCKWSNGKTNSMENNCIRLHTHFKFNGEQTKQMPERLAGLLHSKASTHTTQTLHNLDMGIRRARGFCLWGLCNNLTKDQ